MDGHLFVKPNAVESPVQKEHSVPHNRVYLDNAGEWVPDNVFWNIRLLHKDVVPAEAIEPKVDAALQEVPPAASPSVQDEAPQDPPVSTTSKKSRKA